MYAKWIPEDGRFAFALHDNGGVEISLEQHAALMEGQSTGSRIVVDADGWPFLAEQAPVVLSPAAVTMRQARLALLAAGKLASVSTAIAALPSPQKEAAQIEWEYAATVDRDGALTVLLGSALGLSAAQLDALFLAGSAL